LRHVREIMSPEVVEIGSDKDTLGISLVQVFPKIDFSLTEIELSQRKKQSIALTLVALLLIGGCNSPAKDPKNPHHAERDSRVACLNPPLPSDNTLS
jgi:hypothetical protein